MARPAFYTWAGWPVTPDEYEALTVATKPKWDTPIRREAQTAHARWEELNRQASFVEAQLFSAVIGRDITDYSRYEELMDRGR